jgi:hypothetical protein
LFDDVQKLTKTPPPKEKEPPPPFDIRDIPIAMKALNFPLGAKFSQRWLDGRAYVSSGPDAIYAADMIDKTSVTMDWLLKYKDIKANYDSFVKNNSLFTDISKALMKKKLLAFIQQNVSFYGTLDTLAHCKGDIQQLHKQFQFQLQKVSTWDGMKQFGMTDVTAALGGVNFYATIASATIKNAVRFKHEDLLDGTYCYYPTISVTHIYIYAKDHYSFNDTTGKSSSQYLGHWNKKGVIVDNFATAVSAVSEKESILGAKFLALDREIGNSEWSNYVVDTGQRNLIEKEVYYPVRNRDYRNYRDKHDHGGDFVIYSDMKLFKLPNTVDFDLGEICRR